jgi:hypothetical protein
MKTTSTSRAIFASALAGAAVLAPVDVLAQGHSAGDLAQARELLNQGKELREHGDLPNAAEKLKAADALVHTPITATELGRTYLLLGKLIEARETFLSVSRIPVAPEETARSAVARVESAKLAEDVRPRIASLGIHVTGVPIETIAITIDGAMVPNEVLAAPRLVNPGPHALVATSTAGGRADTTVVMKEGETRDVELKIAFGGGTQGSSPGAPGAAPPSAIRPPGDMQRTLGLVGGGVGVAAMGTSAVLALVAKSNFDAATSEPPAQAHTDSVGAHGLADGATVVFVAGAIVAAAGVVVWLTAPKAPVAVGLQNRGVVLSGSFQ